MCTDDICTEFSNLEYEDGEISNFTVNGLAVDDRLTIGNGKLVKHDDLVGFEFLSAYQATSNNTLQVIVKYHAMNRDIDVSYVSGYRDTSGRQVEDLDSYKPSTIHSDSNQLGVLYFANAKVGGTAMLKFSTEDNEPLVVDTVDVPASGH